MGALGGLSWKAARFGICARLWVYSSGDIIKNTVLDV